METVALVPGQSWPAPAYDSSTSTLSLGTLPPELLLLLTTAKNINAQTDGAKLSVKDAYQRLEELRDQIAEAMERAQEAQEDAGFWGDISEVFGGDIATVASVVAAAALVVGSGGAGLAVVAAALAVGFTVGGEVGEELGLDPKIVMALKIAGAVAGLAAGNACAAGSIWSSIYAGAKITEGGAIAVGGGAHIVEGQYQGDAADERAEAKFLRGKAQLELSLTDDQIAAVEKLFEQLAFLSETATDVSTSKSELEESVIRRIGG
jgi:hypothetical protein